MSALGIKMEQIRSELATRYPLRVVTRSLVDFADRPQADLLKGVYTVAAQSEDGYQNSLGREAMFGRVSLVIIGQILVASPAPPAPPAAPVATEEAEFTMVEEIKTFVRTLPLGIDALTMLRYRQSGQLEHPYGWIAIDLEMMQ